MHAGSHRVALSLEACLEPWLDCFSHATTQWGLVTDVRADGSTYLRHGVVVELLADFARPLEAASHGDELLLQRLRHAADLVKLALAVDPLALKPLLWRRSWLHRLTAKYERDPSLSAEELQDLARRDVPFELCLRLEMEPIELHRLHSIGMHRFMRTLDETPADETDALRRYLVDQALRSASAQRLQLVPVRTVLAVGSSEQNADKSTHGWRRLEGLVNAMDSFLAYQAHRGPQWSVKERRAPLAVERLDLRLGFVPLVGRVLKTAMRHVARGLPVCITDVTIDVRSMSCEEPELQAFLEAIATTSEWVSIHTISLGSIVSIDLSTHIATVLRCIGHLDHSVSVDLSGLFAYSDEERIDWL